MIKRHPLNICPKAYFGTKFNIRPELIFEKTPEVRENTVLYRPKDCLFRLSIEHRNNPSILSKEREILQNVFRIFCFYCVMEHECITTY